MKWTSWPFLAEYEMNAGVDRLSMMKLPPRSALDVDPNLKLVSERGPACGFAPGGIMPPPMVSTALESRGY